MKATDYGRARVRTDEFKKTLNFIRFQLIDEGKDRGDISGILATYVALALCTEPGDVGSMETQAALLSAGEPGDVVSMCIDEVTAFVGSHAHEIEQILTTAKHYAEKRASSMALFQKMRPSIRKRKHGPMGITGPVGSV